MKIDREVVKKMRDEINGAMIFIGKKYDVTFHAGNCTFSDTEVKYQLKAVVNDKATLEAEERKTWDDNCELWGFKKSDWGKTFSCRGVEYKVCGLCLSRPKFSLKGEAVVGGKRLLFVAEDVVSKLRAKEVTK